MKIAQIKNSLTSAVLQPDGSYVFGNCRPGRGQCGEYVNDTLNLQGINRAGDTLASKMDGTDFVKVENGWLPIAGGYFVMTYGATGHIGLIRKPDYAPGQENTATGLKGAFITDYNWDLHEGRRDTYLKVGSSDWKKIVGGGVGNPTVDFSVLTPLEERSIIPTISAMYAALDTLPANDKRLKAKEHLHLANEALRA